MATLKPHRIHSDRIKVIKKVEKKLKNVSGPVIYWMSRDQRVVDNFALLHAQNVALSNGSSLVVVFNLMLKFPSATYRMYHFMLNGLKMIEKKLKEKNIPFFLLHGDNAIKNITEFIEEIGSHTVIMDLSALRIGTIWRNGLSSSVCEDVEIRVVDAGNVVPVWEASQKQEWAARTIRPKINGQLKQFLVKCPTLHVHSVDFTEKSLPEPVDWDQIDKNLIVDRSVEPISWCEGGEENATQMLQTFLEDRLPHYKKRNDPCNDVLSCLSSYLHFGHIWAGTAAKAALTKKSKYKEEVASFVEELIVRRELSFNFCYYNQNYDQLDKMYPKFNNESWAQKTLAIHKDDVRDYVYTQQQWENAETHCELWNAAQIELILHGKMHGYMRMFWCKKILEWSASPEEALAIGLYLNDKYSIDGRDPSGYVGVAWSVAGLHDRAHREREVYGKVRYMAESGCKRKFKVDQYLEKIANLGKTKNFKHELVTKYAKPKTNALTSWLQKGEKKKKQTRTKKISKGGKKKQTRKKKIPTEGKKKQTRKRKIPDFYDPNEESLPKKKRKRN